LFLTIISSIAELEADLIKERIRAGTHITRLPTRTVAVLGEEDGTPTPAFTFDGGIAE
jgi:hypothetical protein